MNRMKTTFIGAMFVALVLLGGVLHVSVAQPALLQTTVPSSAASPTPSPLPTITPTSTPSIPQRLETLENRVNALGNPSSLSTWKVVVDILGGLATVVALMVSGWWAYRLFVHNRLGYPRAVLSHHVTHWPLANGQMLLHVELTISNVGDILVSLGSLMTWIQQVSPPPAEVLDLLRDGRDLVKDGESEYGWPAIGSCDLDFRAQQPEIEPGEREPEVEPEIEPGESEEICFDFVLATGVQVVKVNSYLKNEAKHDREIGWNLTTLYDLADTAVEVNESHL